MKKDRSNIEKHVSKGTLEKLLKAKSRMESEAGTARQAYGDALSTAANLGLNPWAFRQAAALHKMDPGKAAQNIRALELYIDHLGLAAQTDLEDVIDDTAEEAGAWDDEANGVELGGDESDAPETRGDVH